MALIEIKRVCKECESTRSALREYVERVDALERQIDDFRLDYHSLYEKVRRNLARLAKRAESPPEDTNGKDETDPMAHYRKMALERKLRGPHGL